MSNIYYNDSCGPSAKVPTFSLMNDCSLEKGEQPHILRTTGYRVRVDIDTLQLAYWNGGVWMSGNKWTYG